VTGLFQFISTTFIHFKILAMKVNLFRFLLILMVFNGACQSEQSFKILQAPAENLQCKVDLGGQTVIPNGRFLTPVGKSILVAPHPYGLAISNDGIIAVTANSGINPLSVSIIKNLKTENPQILQIPPGPFTDKGILASVFMGIAISPDKRVVYVSGGQENKIYIFNIQTGVKEGVIDCSVSAQGEFYEDGYIGDLTISSDGNWIFAVDQIQFRMLIINTSTKEVVRNVGVGRYPFGIALSPDEKKVYVANVGMFEYKPIRFKSKSDTGLTFPPFGFGTEVSKTGYSNDSVEVPGLGDSNVTESFSVWAVDVSDINSARVIAKIKTGHLVGDLIEGIPAVGGSSPNSLVATDQFVFVSNGNNDNITVIDIANDTILAEIYLHPIDAFRNFRGVIPFGLAVSPDQKRLYVAESGINAIGVIDIPALKVIGHIPTGWFPSKLKVTPDGKRIVVANAKGFGSGPNGGRDFSPGDEGTYIGSLMKGSVQVFDIPDDADLPQLTEKVVSNNFKIQYADDPELAWREKNPVPLYGGQNESPIKYIVFISKENRTYDEIFGQNEKGDGDPTLARYGSSVTFTNRSLTDTVENATVMPNHLNLAKEFAMADNFYVDSDVSADGHRWLANTYPNEWVEAITPASYGENRDFKYGSKAPGIYAMNMWAGAVYPEDYNEAGSMWDHLDRNGVGFFNFGFGIMFEPAIYHESFKYTGIRHFVNYPVPQPMFDRTSKTYPTYNMAIPDQFRVDQFIKEFNEKWMDGKTTMPQMLTVIIPNDHGAGERPEAGYPFRESYMADNDLAIGRIVEFLSHTPYWKNMAIVITEDDAQNGVDHVDAHRSVLMVISPWVKRDYVGHVHYSFGSIFKTFWNILGLPYLNQYDAGATDLADMFTDTPNFKPYKALPADLRFFDPQKALDPFDEKFDWKALDESPVIDKTEDMLKDSKEKPEYRIEDRERKK
jgi:YVTN family beta-propeller protein